MVCSNLFVQWESDGFCDYVAVCTDKHAWFFLKPSHVREEAQRMVKFSFSIKPEIDSFIYSENRASCAITYVLLTTHECFCGSFIVFGNCTRRNEYQSLTDRVCQKETNYCVVWSRFAVWIFLRYTVSHGTRENFHVAVHFSSKDPPIRRQGTKITHRQSSHAHTVAIRIVQHKSCRERYLDYELTS